RGRAPGRGPLGAGARPARRDEPAQLRPRLSSRGQDDAGPLRRGHSCRGGAPPARGHHRRAGGPRRHLRLRLGRGPAPRLRPPPRRVPGAVPARAVPGSIRPASCSPTTKSTPLDRDQRLVQASETVDHALRFLVEHGAAVLFAVSLVNQLGLPFPAMPWLLGAGALARGGQLDLVGSIAIAMVASVLAHAAWYEAGRRRGAGILRLVCRVTLEPDACVRKSHDLFARRGARALVIAPFVPGLATAAQPMAGILRMPRLHFLGYNAVGSLLWAGGFIALGFPLPPAARRGRDGGAGARRRAPRSRRGAARRLRCLEALRP